MIHGSSEGRFRITYAPGHLTGIEIESIGYNYLPLDEALVRYHPEGRAAGWHETAYGERFYFIPTPAAGLWATRTKLVDRAMGFAS